MKYILLLMCSLFPFYTVVAQSEPAIIDAEVVSGVILQDSGDYHFFLVSFINRSNKKIYIPDIKNMLLVDTCSGAVIVTRNDSLYTNYSDLYEREGTDMAIGYRKEPLPLINFKMNQIKMHLNNHRIVDRYISQKEMRGRGYSFLASNCLYLNPKEKKEGVLLIKIELSDSNMFTIPGHYKIFYKPMLDSSHTKDYPDEVNGYKKFIPHKIHSNILYIDVVK